MGKKGRRTRWRTLTIADENSDSEESNTTTSGQRIPKGYSQKYYSRFTYSSQSTPTRRFQYDGTKSTRSSSTASENKITFNEDEYTRITTPRQDVLFKKGYLNKPKTYQSQTSTGNSTTSTGNSTGNGTPDHQSTDLEYESQFVFPNGFVDQNGIYYVNSFEPYPVMVFNPPTYYPEYANVKSKRCSTGSLTESTSPNNEETSQDLSQSETPSNVSDLNQMYNVIYPGYYYNGVCQPPESVVESEPPRRVKKRRRRKLSRSKQDGTTSESSDEVFSDEDAKPETEEKTPEEETPTVEEKTPEQEQQPEVEKNDHHEDEKEEEEETPKAKYDLKPDAEEFVPRAYRQPETTIPMDVQFIKLPSNFVPVPILNPMGDFNAFIPTGIPINFIPPNFVNFVPYKQPPPPQDDESEVKKEETKETHATVEVPTKNAIDIAKIVSKLEEAAKEQNEETKEETAKNPPTTTAASAVAAKKRFRYQKVDLKKPEPPERKKPWKQPPPPNPSPKKELPPEVKKIVVRNYSDTLKKIATPVAAPSSPKTEKTKIGATKEFLPKKEERVPKAPDDWIPVSRKKRKNKNVEETEDFEEVEEKTEEKAKIEEETVEERITPPTAPPPSPVETPPPEPKKPEETKKAKKKSKRNHHQAQVVVTKRVIITDVDLTTMPEVKIEETKQEEKEEESKTAVDVEEEVYVVVEPVATAVVVEEVAVEEELPKPEEEVQEKKETEKKGKKKKKKVAAKTAAISESSSSATLNVAADDSYDFLLDESLDKDKTNVEVSQELDRMIQRGMYTSLEEKIRASNMPEPSDAFFKTIIGNISSSSREPSVEKGVNPYAKVAAPDLRALLAKPAASGDFLCDATATDRPIGGGGGGGEAYPITRAVKEWMTKTRETTPDVEILKSPSTIFREFYQVEDEEEVVYERRISSCSSAEEAEEVDGEYRQPEMADRVPKHGDLPYRAICCSIM